MHLARDAGVTDAEKLFRAVRAGHCGRMKTRAALGLMLLVCAPLACAGARPATATVASSDAIAVRLHRPHRVGARAHLVVEAEKHNRVHSTVDGAARPDETQDAHTELDAVQRVIAVDAQGRVTESELTVARLVRNDQSLLRDGRVVHLTVAARSQDAVITVDGAPADAPLRAALDEVLTLERGSDLTDDDIFGSAQPRAVGATWSIDGPRASADLRAHAGIVTTLTGETRLARRITSRDVDCVEVLAEMHGDLIEVPELPPGMSVRSGTIEARFRSVLPVDVTLGAHVSQEAMHTLTTIGGTVEGRAVVVRVEFAAAKQRDETAL